MVCHLCYGKVILQGFLTPKITLWHFIFIPQASPGVISNPGIRMCSVCRFFTHIVLRRQVSNFKSIGCQEPCQGQEVFMLGFVEDRSVEREVGMESIMFMKSSDLIYWNLVLLILDFQIFGFRLFIFPLYFYKSYSVMQLEIAESK